MLNGQLSLTGTFSMNTNIMRRPVRWAGVLGLVALAGCAGKATRAPVVDLTNQPASSATATAGGYVVKPGDTLFKIARANNVDIETIKRLNSLSDPNQIHVGQVLKLSSAPAATRSLSPSQAARFRPNRSMRLTVTPLAPIPAPLLRRSHRRRRQPRPNRSRGLPTPESSTGDGRPAVRSSRTSTPTARA